MLDCFFRICKLAGDRAWLELDNGVGLGEMPALKVLRSHDMLNQAVGDIVAEFRCF